MSTTATPTLPDLADRVSALEQIAGAGTDTLQPNLITVSPTGQIGAKFTGLVNALGLIIPVGNAIGEMQNEITWVRQSDGATVAYLDAVDLNLTSNVFIQSNVVAPDNQSAITLTAEGNPQNTQTASLYVGAAPPGSKSMVVAAAGEANVGVIAADRSSSFLQLTADSPSFLSWGVATSGTGVVATPGSGDWMCSGPTTGELTIDFPARTNTPCVIATGYSSSSNVIVQVLGVSTNSVTLLTFTPGGALENTLVGFAILGGT